MLYSRVSLSVAVVEEEGGLCVVLPPPLVCKCTFYSCEPVYERMNGRVCVCDIHRLITYSADIHIIMYENN